MINQPTTAPGNEPPRRLQLPLQAPPIDRSQSPASAIAAGSGVEADWGWPKWLPDIDLDDVISTAGTIGKGLLSDRALKRDIIPVDWRR